MNPETTVGQLVVERPSRSRVFEKFGIDYCCGGKKSLLAVCREKDLDSGQVLSCWKWPTRMRLGHATGLVKGHAHGTCQSH